MSPQLYPQCTPALLGSDGNRWAILWAEKPVFTRGWGVFESGWEGFVVEVAGFEPASANPLP
ncbi:hypothetical protein [Nitrincola nitratireducens]|uniref:hypothetical protein n=1 Tax=Nitrincola nitratireducens TaxID=1229521 RepID=UPI0012FA865A|nr:hypothetical protein [Nitrincola nitratireducens]